ncbi:hypothetical protein [Almyronema epifaneia]|uniref:Uncharacterized protein n=1 Tax=Almyronema epifaneia S1 TaxID=2991925 RepID=A0ABW6ILF8_9CYAN
MPETKTCPICGVKILVGVIGGDRVLFSVGPPGDRAKLWARVCQYNQKPGCINPDGGQNAQASDYYHPPTP